MIKCRHLEIDGLLLFESEKYDDSRGSFAEVYRLNQFSKFLPNNINFIQDNESFSSKGVLRGLHFQKKPFEQSKLIRVIKGKIQDIAVDLRKESSNYLNYVSVILNEDNKKQLFIPKGFGHAFLTLSDEAIVSYKVDAYYNPKFDSGIKFNDPKLNISWELNNDEIIQSTKDTKLAYLQ